MNNATTSRLLCVRLAVRQAYLSLFVQTVQPPRFIAYRHQQPESRNGIFRQSDDSLDAVTTEAEIVTIDEFSAATGLPRTRIYSAIARGALRSFKEGRRRMETGRLEDRERALALRVEIRDSMMRLKAELERANPALAQFATRRMPLQ